jgi:hypothetical protein
MPPASSEQNFRANLSQFRWARGNTDDSQPATQPAQGGNPFSRFYNAVAGDYIPLRSSEQSNEDEAWFALSRWERCVFKTVKDILANTENAVSSRLLGFGGCLIGAAICFFVSFMTLPFLAIKLVKLVIFLLCTVSHDSNPDLQSLPSHLGAQNSLSVHSSDHLTSASSQLGQHASHVRVSIFPHRSSHALNTLIYVLF